jgi:hypothetical protein
MNINKAWNYIFEKSCDNYNQITVVIKTFFRQQCCINNIKNWNLYYPNIKIIVIDDTPYDMDLSALFSNVSHIKTSFNIGSSAGRNLGLSLVKTKYAFLNDDDDMILPSSNILEIQSMLEQFNLDIIGKKPFRINITKNINDTSDINMFSLPESYITPCDATQNFFMCKNPNDLCLWDENLKIGPEHLDFFLTCKIKNKKIAGTNKLSFATDIRNKYNKTYYSYRDNKKNKTKYITYFNKKWNINRIKTPWDNY